MTLIKSISGIRGTIGGKPYYNLTPIDIVKFTSAYGTLIQENNKQAKIVVGRDARISGSMCNALIINTLSAMGIEVIDLGLSTTPTVEVMVPKLNADGGIIITASHNPKQWNALKLLNAKGEFISGEQGNKLIQLAENDEYEYAEVENLGLLSEYPNAIEEHIQEVLDLPVILQEKIKTKKYKVVIDGVNSTGGIALPLLLETLGCEVIKMYTEPTGDFPHNPEPLAENLHEIMAKVPEENADLGIVVDPDVDRLAFVSEDGSLFGEEYTLVAVADYVLSKTPGPTVSNLSSTRALRDVTEKYGEKYYAAAVGEVNVVEKMKEVKAVIGGEGNGGVIYPALHYGRDALVGIGLFLSLLTEKNMSMTALKSSYPHYAMSKNKINLSEGIVPEEILKELEKQFSDENTNTIDGLKIDFENEWVHMRKSNTEPIIRIYTESTSQENADQLAQKFLGIIDDIASV